MSIVSRLIDTIDEFFTAVGRVVFAFFKAAIDEAVHQLGEEGIAIIRGAVTAAESTGGSGEEKRKAAQSAILSGLAAAGIKASISVVNVGIEAAVLEMQHAAKSDA